MARTLGLLVLAVSIAWHGYGALLGAVIYCSGSHKRIWKSKDYSRWQDAILITVASIVLFAVIWQVQ